MNKKVMQKLTAITTAAVLAASIAPMSASAAWNKDANANWSWTENGQKSTGWKWIHGNWYYFDGSGIMQTGWKFINSQWYYMDQSGAMKTGWQFINGEWYHLAANGAMTKGWYKEGSYWYHLNENGVMSRHWRKISNKWYHFNPSGQMSIGWINWHNNHYFSSKDGVMQTGLVQIDNKVYYFDEVTGELQTGRIKIGNITYTFGEDGAATGALLPKAEIAFDANGNEKTPGDVISGGETSKPSRPSGGGSWGGGGSSYVEVQSISLNKTSHIMTVGDDFLLTAAVYPSNATNKKVSWISSDESIATVTNGYVRALKEGTVTIKAIADTVEATCEIEVMAKGGQEEVKVTSITVSSTNGKNEAHVGETLQLQATVKPDDATNKGVTWSSDDKAVATVDANGLVKGVKEGKATITATAKDGSGVTGTFDVEITAKPATESATPTFTKDLDAAKEVKKGDSVTLSVTASASDSGTLTYQWYKGDQAIDGATDASYTFTADTVGSESYKVVVTNTKDNLTPATATSKTCVVTVTAEASDFVAVTDITDVPTVATAGTDLTLTGTVAPDTATNKTIVWSVSDAGETGATIEGNVLKTTAAGTVTVTATIANGAAVDADFTKNFTIAVKEAAVESENLIAGKTYVTSLYQGNANAGMNPFYFNPSTSWDGGYGGQFQKDAADINRTALTDGLGQGSALTAANTVGFYVLTRGENPDIVKYPVDITFDLGEGGKTFYQINLDTATDYSAATHYTIKVSDTGLSDSWKTILDTDVTGSLNKFKSDSPITARFVRIEANNSGGWLGMNEIEIMSMAEEGELNGTLVLPAEVDTVEAVQTPIAFTEWSGSSGQDAGAPFEVAEGTKYTFKSLPFRTDVGTVTYQWQKSENGTDNWVDIPDATEQDYTITAVAPEDEGYYRVVVTNTIGDKSAQGFSTAVQMTIGEAPTEVKPADVRPNFRENRVEQFGSSIVLSAVATSVDNGTISYQWYKDDTLLEEETGATLTLNDLSADDAGVYKVEVTNTLTSELVDTTTLTCNLRVENLENVAIGKTYTMTDLDDGEIAFGDWSGGDYNKKLTDGVTSTDTDYKNGAWLGISGAPELEIVIDLGSEMDIDRVDIDNLKSTAGIGYARSGIFSYSTDGRDWKEISDFDLTQETGTNEVNEPDVGIKTLSASLASPVKARYVKLVTEAGQWFVISEFRVYSATEAPAFVPVTDITGVPTEATAGTDLELTGTVAPENATNKTIVWSVSDAGETGATIEGNVLKTTAAGTVKVTATIANGAAEGTAYTKEFTITVEAPVQHDNLLYGIPFESTTAKVWGSGLTEDQVKGWMTDGQISTSDNYMDGYTTFADDGAVSFTYNFGKTVSFQQISLIASVPAGLNNRTPEDIKIEIQRGKNWYLLCDAKGFVYDGQAKTYVFTTEDGETIQADKLKLTVKKPASGGSWGGLALNELEVYATPKLEDSDGVLKEVAVAQQPVITKNLSGAVGAVEGNTVTLSVEATKDDDGTLSYEWFKDGASLGAEYNTNTLEITATSLEDAGKYYCVVSNTVADSTQTAQSNTCAVVVAKQDADNILTGLSWTTEQAPSNFYGYRGPNENPPMIYWLTDGLRVDNPTVATEDGLVSTGGGGLDMTFDLGGLKAFKQIAIGTKYFDSEGNGIQTPSHVKVEVQCGTDEWITVYDADIADAGAHKDIILGVKDDGEINATMLKVTISKGDGRGWGTSLDEVAAKVSAPSGETDGLMEPVAAPDFIAVSDITGVPTETTAGEDLTLTGTVAPSGATNQTIVWSVKDVGTTGATIEGNVLKTTAAGTVTVTATIANGAAVDSDFTKDFTITVKEAPVESENLLAGKEWTSTTVEEESYGPGPFPADASKWLTDGLKPTPNTISGSSENEAEHPDKCGVALFMMAAERPVQSFVYDLDASKGFKQIQISTVTIPAKDLAHTPKTIQIEAFIDDEWVTIFKNAEPYADEAVNRNFVFSSDTAINASQLKFSFEGQAINSWPGAVALNEIEVLTDSATGDVDGTLTAPEAPVVSDNLLSDIPFTTTLPDNGFFYGDLGNNPTAKPAMLTYLTDGQRIEEPTAGTQDGIVATGNTPFDMTFDLNGVKDIRSIVIGTKWFEQDGALLRTPSHVKVEIQNGSDEWVTVFDGDFEDAGAHKDIVLGVADGEAISASKLRITTTKREGSWGTALDEIIATSKAPEGAVDGTLAIQVPAESFNVLSGVTYTTNITENDGQFQPAHPDADGSRLTDGIKATTNGSGLDWNNPAYVGLTKNPEIVLTFDDLGGGKSIESINLGFLQNLTIAAYVPKAVKIEAKDAEGAWSEVKTANYQGESVGENKIYEETIVFNSPVVAYGLRFSFTPDAYYTEEPFAPKEDGTWGWLFIDEIEAIGKDIVGIDAEIEGWGDGGSVSGEVTLG